MTKDQQMTRDYLVTKDHRMMRDYPGDERPPDNERPGKQTAELRLLFKDSYLSFRVVLITDHG